MKLYRINTPTMTVTVGIIEAIENSRWETTYIVCGEGQFLDGELFFLADSDNQSEPNFDGKRTLLSKDIDASYYSVEVPVKEWMMAKKDYYQSQGIFFDWMENI